MPCDMDGRRIMVTNGDIGGEGGGDLAFLW